ncbi:MAG: hypothetical protein K0S04_880 [Herbinix sp.]|nr:hypothetical protein [Herbinix sp.]
MKKFGKFIFGTLAVASAAAGAYYFYKTYIKKTPENMCPLI